MKALRITQKIDNSNLLINLPSEYLNRKVEIIILTIDGDTDNINKEIKNKEKNKLWLDKLHKAGSGNPKAKYSREEIYNNDERGT